MMEVIKNAYIDLLVRTSSFASYHNYQPDDSRASVQKFASTCTQRMQLLWTVGQTADGPPFSKQLAVGSVNCNAWTRELSCFQHDVRFVRAWLFSCFNVILVLHLHPSYNPCIHPQHFRSLLRADPKGRLFPFLEARF